MVDFTRETLVDVRGVSQRLDVCPLTVRRWMKQGLEYAKVGGKVVTSLEALNRFAKHGSGDPPAPSVVIDQACDSLRQLRDRFGITTGPEANRDARKKVRT